ncbi:hypothetical protein [Fischerella muscicola]|nr:hypothetical protein [Fischerella muscicola]
MIRPSLKIRQMADGRWQMADGRWQMAEGVKIFIFGCAKTAA